MARERVFARSWQWIGDLDAVREHSSLSPRTLLPGFLDEPLLLALDRVEAEDQSIVEAVQRGVSSRLYRGGRYSVAHERGVHHFHRLLTAAWAEAPG